MFDVRRYMGMEPWAGLITMISDRTYLNLEPAACTLEALESLGGLSTKVTISTNRSTSPANLLPPLPKTLEYTFDRLDPALFFRTGATPVLIDGLRLPINTEAIVQRLGEFKGINFDVDDFEQIEVTEYGEVVLQSKPDSLRWVGQLPVTLVNSNQRQLSDALVIKSVSSVFRSLGGTGRVLDIIYSAEHDFTTYRADMKAMLKSPNGIDTLRLLNILRWVTGDTWVCQDSPAQFNLCVDLVDSVPTWEILYAGRPVERFTPRTDKRNLIVLRIDTTRCTGLSGALLLHYD